MIAVLAGFLVPPLGRTGGASAPPRDLFDDLYARGQSRHAGLRTLTASFTESTTSSLLTQPLVARGIVAIERPSHVALRYTDPDERSVVIAGDRMTVTWPARNLRHSRDIGASQRRVHRYFIDSSPDELRSHFDIAARETGDRRGYLVTMTPKRNQIREGLSRLELWIDSTSLLPSSMRMTFPGGETKTMTFTDVRANAALDPATFDAAKGRGN